MVVAGSIAICLLVSPFLGRAVAGNGEDSKQYLDKATGAFALSRYVVAAENFEKAYELSLDPALLYNAAQSHRLAGNKQRALELYQSYLRMYGSEKREEIEKHVDVLRKAIEQDHAIATSPPVTTDPTKGTGNVAPIAAWTPSRPLRKGGPPDQPPSAELIQGGTTPAHVPTAWPWQRKAGLTLVGGGVVALGLGVTFHLLRESRVGDFNEAGCFRKGDVISGPPSCSGLQEKEMLARDLAIASYAGAALLGGGGALLLVKEGQPWPTRVGVTLVGAGVAALSLGAIFHAVREERVKDFNSAGCSTNGDVVLGPDDCAALRRREWGAASAAIASYAAGTVVAGAGVILLIVGRRQAPPLDTAATTRGFRCGPALGHEAGVVCAGVF